MKEKDWGTKRLSQAVLLKIETVDKNAALLPVFQSTIRNPISCWGAINIFLAHTIIPSLIYGEKEIT